jgi:hypothetical protein
MLMMPIAPMASPMHRWRFSKVEGREGRVSPFVLWLLWFAATDSGPFPLKIFEIVI